MITEPSIIDQDTITTYTGPHGQDVRVEGGDPRVLRTPGCCCVVAAAECGVPLIPEQARHLAGRLVAAADAVATDRRLHDALHDAARAVVDLQASDEAAYADAVAALSMVQDPPESQYRYAHETCPNCLDPEARETKGMVCQSCGHDYAPDVTAQDPPELESPSGELTPREQALVAVYVAMEEYNACRDGIPQALIPPSLRETIVDAVMGVFPAPPVTEDTSDGFHTFAEMYEHRHALWCAFAAHMLRGHGRGMVAWKSRAHHPADQPCYPGHFIAGTNLPGCGQVSYHLPDAWWDACPGHVLPHAPAWDHHSPSDVVSRLTAHAALTAQATGPDRGFRPIPDRARDAGAAALAALRGEKSIRPVLGINRRPATWCPTCLGDLEVTSDVG